MAKDHVVGVLETLNAKPPKNGPSVKPNGFITSYVKCPDQLNGGFPISMAQGGSNLYFSFQDNSSLLSPLSIALCTDKGLSINRRSFETDPARLTLAGYQENLYVGYADRGDNRISLGRATLDSSGNVTALVLLGKAVEATDGWPRLFSSPNGLYMAWQNRHDIPYLGFAKFDVPSSPPSDLLSGFPVHKEFQVKTTPYPNSDRSVLQGRGKSHW